MAVLIKTCKLYLTDYATSQTLCYAYVFSSTGSLPPANSFYHLSYYFHAAAAIIAILGSLQHTTDAHPLLL